MELQRKSFKIWSGRWESNCIPKSKVLRFDGVAARSMSQLEPNGAKST
jgi:hypothetical protein